MSVKLAKKPTTVCHPSEQIIKIQNCEISSLKMSFFSPVASKKSLNPLISISGFHSVLMLQPFMGLQHLHFYFHSYRSECVVWCAYLIFRFASGNAWSYHRYYISATGFLNPASKCIVTPDDEQNDLISCIPRDICADEGARCIRPPFPFFCSLSWNQSCL